MHGNELCVTGEVVVVELERNEEKGDCETISSVIDLIEGAVV